MTSLMMLYAERHMSKPSERHLLSPLFCLMHLLSLPFCLAFFPFHSVSSSVPSSVSPSVPPVLSHPLSLPFCLTFFPSRSVSPSVSPVLCPGEGFNPDITYVCNFTDPTAVARGHSIYGPAISPQSTTIIYCPVPAWNLTGDSRIEVSRERPGNCKL